MASMERTRSVGFETFFREWYPRLVVLGVTMTGRRDVAQDVAQESLLRAHQRWIDVSGYDLPGAWVKRVAVNLLVDHLRRVGREREAMARLGSVAASESTDAPDHAADRWVMLLDGLTDRQRAIVTLFYADDQSVGAIAELLEVAPGTVKAQLFKARERLRANLEREEWS
jgi:RNA polymerase sigma-70 factor (ECF subfamily)